MLFNPHRKVQKDRRVMRQTDSRLAKYARRGILIHLLVYLAVLALGDFSARQPLWSLVLGTVLLLLLAARAWLLWRFDGLYPRAPARWRERYLLLTLLTMGWWGLLVASYVWVLGLAPSTELLILYTVVFSAVVANVLAPYERYWSLALSVTILPLAAATAALLTPLGLLHSVMLLVFFLVLNHQGKAVSETYWDHLESLHHLQKRAQVLETEKRGRDALLDNKRELLSELGAELRTPLNDLVGSLTLLRDTPLSHEQQQLAQLAENASGKMQDLLRNLQDYNRLLQQNLTLETTVFNLRATVEAALDDVVPEAQQHRIDLLFRCGHNVPLRVQGDPGRLRQVVSYLVSYAIGHADGQELILSLDFLEREQQGGQLELSLSGAHGDWALLADRQQQPTADAIAATGLGLALVRGLVAAMGGTIGVRRQGREQECVWLRLPLPLAGSQQQEFAAHPQLQQTRLWLVDVPRRLAADTERELAEWGLQVDQPSLRARLHDPLPDVLLWYLPPGELDTAPPWLSRLNGTDTQLLIVGYPQQRQQALIQQTLSDNPSGHFLVKPLKRQALHDALVNVRVMTAASPGPVEDTEDLQGHGQRILLVDDHQVNQMVTQGMLKKLNYRVATAQQGEEALAVLEREAIDLVLMDCEMPGMDGFTATREVRLREADSGRHIPIVAMTAHAGEGDEARCLAAGMDDYLAKPVRLEDLGTCLRRWLGKGSDAQSLSSTQTGA